MKHIIKVNDIQDAIQCRIRPIVAKDVNNKLYVSTKMPPLMKTIFHYSDGTTSESTDTVITKSSYESLIPEGAYLTSVEIGNNVTSIGDSAFESASITSINIPGNVTSIGNNAFGHCISLTTVTIEEGLVSIGDYAFDWCTSLTTINIPNSLRYANDPFLNVHNITSILYNSHIFVYMPNSYSGEYIIQNGIETIAGGAFSYCKNLTSVTIPNSVTSIGEYAFYGCKGLTSVTIPNSVESIGYLTFTECVNLSNIIIGNEPSLTRLSNIGYLAFFGMYHSSTITCNAIEPPIIDRGAGFANSYTIYVPAQSIDVYKDAPIWSTIVDRIFPIS